MEELKLPFYIKSTIVLVGVIAFCYLMFIGRGVIIPFVFALFIAILTNPLVNFLTRKKINRIVAIFLSVLLVLLFTAALLFFISLQISAFSETFPHFKEKFNAVLTALVNWSSQVLHMDPASIQRWLSETQATATKSISGGVAPALLSVGGSLVFVVIIPVYVFLILYYKSLLLTFVGKLFHVRHHQTVMEILQSTNIIIRSYLTGLLIEGIIVAVLNSIALLVLGVEYAILLGISGAILNVIPFIGGIVAVALPMLVAFVTRSPLSALLVFILYIIIQFIDNHYLIPYIVASKVRINALAAIVVVLLGDVIWGIPGMFLSIPLTALVKVICDHIEPLKPYGFLLGDDIPISQKLFNFKKVKVK